MAALESESEAAAAELKRLVAKRTVATRRTAAAIVATVATGMLTAGAYEYILPCMHVHTRLHVHAHAWISHGRHRDAHGR